MKLITSQEITTPKIWRHSLKIYLDLQLPDSISWKYCLFWNINIQVCQHHGAEFVEYKCRYCCSLAVFFCFGTTHFCSRCHDDAGRLRNTTRLAKCPAGPTSISLDSGQCPLKIDHPPTGEEFVLGCAICRNIQSFWCHSLEISITLILPGRKTIFNNREKVQNVFIKRWSSWSGENVAQIIFYVNLVKLTSS